MLEAMCWQMNLSALISKAACVQATHAGKQEKRQIPTQNPCPAHVSVERTAGIHGTSNSAASKNSGRGAAGVPGSCSLCCTGNRCLRAHPALGNWLILIAGGMNAASDLIAFTMLSQLLNPISDCQLLWGPACREMNPP